MQYRKLGCVPVIEPDAGLPAGNPRDIQLEYRL